MSRFEPRMRQRLDLISTCVKVFLHGEMRTCFDDMPFESVMTERA
jgi:hypothetical protein